MATGTLSRSGSSGPSDTLLELGVGFRTRQGARELTDELAKAQEKSLGRARKRQEKQQETSDRRLAKAQEELVERRRRLAVEAIKDETKRRRASIEAEYRDERRRVRALLKERLDANKIAAKDYRRQLDSFDRDLVAVRDRRLAAVPSDALRSRTDRLLQQFGGGLGARAGGLGGLASTAGGAALLGGGVVVGAGVIKGINEAVAAAGSFEDELIEVKKTTGLTKPELDALGDGILELAQRTGVAQNELAAITAIAGQLGITGQANLLGFTETVAKFAAVTELSADQAAEALAKTGRAFGIPVDQLANLASAANELSNTTAARAGDIVDALQRVGASGTNIGLTAAEVAALAATLVDAGVESERAGTSLRNIFTLLLTEAGKAAETAGVTEQAFREMISEDALGAIQLYLGKLNELDAQSRAIEIEGLFGQENVLQVTTLATQVGQLNVNLETSRTAFEEGTSLNREFESSLDALSAQWAIFTATITKAATKAGQTLLPALTGLLKVVNALGDGADGAADAVAGAVAEIGRLADVERAIDRYEDLARKTDRTAEESDELRRITADLAREYPGYITATDSAGNAVRVYAAGIREATEAIRQLRAEEALRAAEQLGSTLVQANRRVRANNQQRATLDEQARRAARGEDVGVNGTRDLAEGRRLNQRFAAEAERERQAAFDDAARGYAEALTQGLGTQFEQKLRDSGIAEVLVIGIRQEAERLGSRESPAVPGPSPGPTPASSNTTSRTTQRERERDREREKKALEDREERVRALGEVTVEAERELGQAGERAQLRIAAAQRERERLVLEGYAAERQAAADAYEGAVAGAELASRQALADAEAAFALADEAAGRLETSAERDAARAAARSVRDRAVREAELDLEASLVEAALVRDTVLVRIDRDRADRLNDLAVAGIEAERARARAAVDADLAAAEAAADRAAREGRAEEAAEARHRAALTRAQVERDRAIAGARAESAARIEAVRASGADPREVAAAEAAEALRLAAEVARARIGFVEDVDEADEEAHEARLDRLDEVAQRVRRVADVVAAELVASLAGGDDLARPGLDLQKAALLEEQRALDESLRRRQISREEHARQTAEIALDQARTEREIQEANAGFFERSYRGVYDLALAALQDYVSDLLVQKAVELVAHTTTEEGKTASTLAGTVARGVALAGEAAESLANAAASITSAIAAQIKQVVSAIPFPFNLGLIPVGVAAVTGAYLGAKKLFFARGGFVGREGERGPDDVEIVVGRGEAVLNSGQQRVVNDALARAGRGGLRQLFRDERRPHRYETGGFAGFTPLLARPRSTSSGEAGAPAQVDLAPLLDEVRAMRGEVTRSARAAETAAEAALDAKVIVGRDARAIQRAAERERRSRGAR